MAQVRCDAASLGVPCTNCVAFSIECKIPTPKRKKVAGVAKSRDGDDEYAFNLYLTDLWSRRWGDPDSGYGGGGVGLQNDKARYKARRRRRWIISK